MRAEQWPRFTLKECAINCPGCSAQVPDDTSICPKCDHIIDESFLTGEAPAKPKPARPAPSGARPAAAGAARPARPAPSGARPAAKAPARPAPRPAPRAAAPAEAEVEDEREVDIPTGPGLQSLPASSRRDLAGPHGQIAAPEDAVRDIKEFVSGLGSADKFAVIGGAVVVLAGLLPWQYSLDGDSLGLLSSGFISVLFAGLAVAAAIIRVRKALPQLSEAGPWLAQVAFALISLLWAVVYSRTASETRTNEMGDLTQVSAPALGVYLAILGGVLCLVGSLLRLREKH